MPHQRTSAITDPVGSLVAAARHAGRVALIALLVGACGTGTATPGTPTPSRAASGTPAQASSSPLAASPGAALPGPNAGRVLFGDSYDHATFVISGPKSQAPQGRDVAFVAHFKRRVAAGQVHVLVVLGGRAILDRAITVTNGPWSVYGAKIPASQLSEAGPLLVRFVDDGSVLLSSGTLTITPGPTASPTPSPAGSTPSPS